MAKTRTLPKGGLSLLLAALFPLAAVTPQLHLTFARHGHYFCAWHHAVEDLPVKTASSEGGWRQRAAGGDSLGPNAGGGAGLSHTRCVSADLSLKSSGVFRTTPHDSSAGFGPTDAGPRLGDFTPDRPIDQAPKQSPPPC